MMNNPIRPGVYRNGTISSFSQYPLTHSSPPICYNNNMSYQIPNTRPQTYNQVSNPINQSTQYNSNYSNNSCYLKQTQLYPQQIQRLTNNNYVSNLNSNNFAYCSSNNFGYSNNTNSNNNTNNNSDVLMQNNNNNTNGYFNCSNTSKFNMNNNFNSFSNVIENNSNDNNDNNNNDIAQMSSPPTPVIENNLDNNNTNTNSNIMVVDKDDSSISSNSTNTNNNSGNENNNNALIDTRTFDYFNNNLGSTSFVDSCTNDINNGIMNDLQIPQFDVPLIPIKEDSSVSSRNINTNSNNSSRQSSVTSIKLPDINILQSSQTKTLKSRRGRPNKSSKRYYNNKKTDWLQTKDINIHKRIECPFCDKTLSKLKMREHVLRHEAIKKSFSGDTHPWKCPVKGCNKKYTQSHNLKKHMRDHNGEKPFSCSKCFKRFKIKTHRDVHMNIHKNDRQIWWCPSNFCEKKYLSLVGLEKHVKSTHKSIQDAKAYCRAVQPVYLSSERLKIVN